MESFLNMSEYRDRHIATCVRNTPHADLEQMFTNWTATLYEARWHETVTCVRDLRIMLPAWRCTWQAGRFKEGVDGQPVANEFSFDIALLSQTLSSSWLDRYSRLV